MKNGADGRSGMLTGALDQWVAAPGVVINVRIAESLQKTLVKLQNVPQMSAGPVRSHPTRRCRVCDVIQVANQPQSLTEPAEVDFDESGLTHTAGTSGGRAFLFRNNSRRGRPSTACKQAA